MEPTFREYDRVFTYNWGKLQKGSVIVFRQNGVNLLKRIKEVKGDEIRAISDNQKKAKKEYHILSKDIVGRVFLKY